MSRNSLWDGYSDFIELVAIELNAHSAESEPPEAGGSFHPQNRVDADQAKRRCPARPASPKATHNAIDDIGHIHSVNKLLLFDGNNAAICVFQ
jgi:hypothetical protein